MRALAIGLTLVASTAAAEPTPTVKPIAGMFLTYVPNQMWQQLPGTQAGLLFTPVSRWGINAGWGGFMFHGVAAEQRKTPTYYFRTNEGSAQALYFEAKKGEGHNFLANWSVPLPHGDARFDAAMFGPTMKNRWGLNRSVHLVELEINGGRGAATNVHFVATKVKVLEGTPGFEIQPERVLDDAKARWDRYVASQSRTIATGLATANQKTPGQAYGKETEGVMAVVIPTWLDKQRVLRVAFYQTTTRASQRTSVKRLVPDCPPGAPCVPPHDEKVDAPVQRRCRRRVQLRREGRADRDHPLHAGRQPGTGYSALTNDETFQSAPRSSITS